MRIDRRDVPWVLLLALSLAIGLAASWRRWGDPLVDCGREMQQPLRLLAGERLYADVAHIYGPLAPHLNALLYRVCGASLGTLYAHGLIAALLILGLTYALARRFMGRAAATLATLTVTWLCALKPSGNYILPYAYAALDACLLTLVSLMLALRYVVSRRPLVLALASASAGLAVLAKTEMGAAAVVATLVAGMVGAPSLRERARAAALALGPAAALVVGTYAAITAQVSWTTLARDSFLIPLHLPAPLVFYNRRMFGFDDPLGSVIQMLTLSARMAWLATGMLVAAVCWTTRRGAASPALSDARRRVLGLLVALTLVIAVTTRQATWDKGPFLTAPLLLTAVLVLALMRLSRARVRSRRRAQLVVLVAFALAILARTLLRVRSGGAYSSYLLPAVVIVFVYAWTSLLPALVPGATARRLTRGIALVLLFVWVGTAAVVTLYRYNRHFTARLETPRGTLWVLPDHGLAFQQALGFILARTRPGDAVAVMPEGTSLLFFSGRRNPFPEEITTPGLLDEERAQRRLVETNAPLVLVANRLTVEFGAPVFGADYAQRLMRLIESRYETCGVFGREARPDARIGDRRFFFRAYCRRAER